MTDVLAGVWRAGTRFVNWYVVDGGDGLTLIDAGLKYLTWPGTWRFIAHAMRADIARPAPMPPAVPLVDGAVAVVPGQPVVTHAPGRTDGSCVLEFREHGVVFVGDL